MLRLSVLLCCGVVSLCGCAFCQAAVPTDFKARQKYLLTQMDANTVYDGCQELMRARKESKNVATGSYFQDDPPAKWNTLPEAIRKLEPTRVILTDPGLADGKLMSVDIDFYSPEGRQRLLCSSPYFLEHRPRPYELTRIGYRVPPFADDRLTGNESLDDLLAEYNTIVLELRPGLTYRMERGLRPYSLEEAKLSYEALLEKEVTPMARTLRRALYQANHPELLKACRDALKDFHAGRFSRAFFFTQAPLGDARAVEDVNRLPAAIRRLDPLYVSFDKNRVTVALTNHLCRSGIEAWAEGDQPDVTADKLPLCDGLWYYDNRLADRGREYYDGLSAPEYRAYLQSLEKEPLSTFEWKRRHTGSGTP